MPDHLQDYLIICIENACCIIFFKIFVNGNKRSKQILLSKLLFIFFLSVFTCVETNLLHGHIYIKPIIDIGLYSFILSLYFKEKLGKCFVLSCIFDGLLYSADFIAILIYPNLIQETSKESATATFLITILTKLFLLLIVMIIDHIFRKNDMKYLKETDWPIFLIMPFFSIAITCAFVKNIQNVFGTKPEQLFIGLGIGLIYMNIIMFYFMQNIGRREYLLREKSLWESETRNKVQLYETFSEQVQKQREITHEYKNQLTCIQSLCEDGEYDKLKAYLTQINGKVLHDLDYIDTNHAFANAIINAKYQEASQKHILVVCKVNDLSKLTMDASDLVILLSNLLNNAIEACEKCEDGRTLKLKCVCEEDELILSIKNTYDGNIKKRGKHFLTTKTKENESHGIGLKHVMRIIEKNGGYHSIEYTQSEFQISIIIPQNPA